MNNIKCRKLSIYVFAISIIVRIAIALLEYFFELSLLGIAIPYVLNFMIIFSAFFIFNKKKVIIFICYPILILLTGINGLMLALDSDNKEFYFKSPNNTNTLIVEECSFLLGGWSNTYKRKYIVFKKTLTKHHITTDDGYRPFSGNDYTIDWINEDTFKIEYGYGSNNIRQEVTININ